MKFSYNWIREYVDLPADLSMKQLSYDLTMRTVEVEGTENLAEALDQVVIGVIKAIEPHPQADRLAVCKVDVGLPEQAVIVCGGINLAVDQKVAVALPGSMVRWHGEGEPVQVKKAKLRGVESYGMICASSEIGLKDLFPSSDEREIMDLSTFEAEAGTALAEVLLLDDQILEIDNKSMTNRPDLWGHYGIARELAAIYNKPLKALPTAAIPDQIAGFPVEIDAADRCNRYIAAVYSGLKYEPSPYWLKLKLWKVGLRPINNLVDITNYVMLATGQPTHGFDKDHVDEKILVRNARTGEKLEMLDSSMLELSQDDLVICDANKPMALAGIMGGKSDSILPETTEMILELAKFNPTTTRRSAQRHSMRTEAGIRNEKGVDAERMDQAMGVADQMIKELIPGAKLTAYEDCWPVHVTYPEIEVPMSFLNVRLGRELDFAAIAATLKPLGFEVSEGNKTEKDTILKVKVPSWRGTGDIDLPDDILEEVARMIGYENFDFMPPRITLDRAIRQRKIETERAVKEYLAFRAGFNEIFTYPWVDDQYLEAASIDPASCLRLATPPSPETSHLRSSLVPGLLEAIAKNLRYFDKMKIFELTQVFEPGATNPSEEAETLPLMRKSLAAAIVGKDPVKVFREAKGVIELMPRIAQIEGLSFAQQEKPGWADQKVWLNIMSDDQVIGTLALLSVQAMHAADIRKTMAAVIELDLEKLEPLPSRENKYQPLPQLPLVEQDFSVLVDRTVKWQEIEDLISGMVKRCAFVEEYTGKQVPDDKKSVMFRVWLGSDTKTLTAEEIDAESQRILNKIKKKLGGEIRQG